MSSGVDAKKRKLKWSLSLLSLLVSTGGCAVSGGIRSPSKIITVVPFEIHDNRMVVQVTLNGQGPYSMIFDTGGANIVTPRVREALAAKVLSQGKETGAGEGAVDSQQIRVRSLELGGLRLADQEFEVLDLDRIRNAFRFDRLDGIIGYEVLQRARARISFDRRTIEFLEPQGSRELSSTSIKFELVGQKPVIQGTVEGKPARILLDTGDRSNLTIFRKFAAASQLDGQFMNRPEVLTGMGVGGPIPGRLAKVSWIDLSRIRVEGVTARLPTTRSGYFATSDLSASVGLGVIQAFNVEFDYQNKVVDLERRGTPPAFEFIPVPEGMN